jgi:hypothetical protein
MDLKKIAVLAAGIVAVGGLAVSGRGDAGAAQESQGDLDNHPLVGTWIVDTDIDNGADAPEVGIFTADGSVFGLGATRWVSGAWEAADDATGTVTMAGVFDENGGGYAVIRGAHEVDESGNAWTCACTFTVVAPDGTVLTSGMATAHAVRLPVETAESSGMPLAGFPAWSPAAPPAATPGA